MRGLAAAGRLAVSDIRLQYRRSTLGPWWNTATLFAQISVIGLLFSRLFDSDTPSYLLHLGAGLITWTFVVTTLNESAQALIVSGPLIRQVLLPVTVHTFRVILKNFILFSHNLVALLPFYFLAVQRPSWWTLLAVPGIGLALLNIGWIAVMFSIISARFRDFPAIIGGVLVLVFYVTPILWSLDQLEGSWVQGFVRFNPFYHVIEVLRAPLLGNPIPPLSAGILLGAGLVGWYLARVLVRWKSSHIAFWV